MSTSTPRRYLLPICLAGLLLTACGVAGYFSYRAWSGGDSAAEPEVAGDLNEGFAEADESASAGAPENKNDRWVEALPVNTVAASPAEEPLDSPPSAPLDPLPPIAGPPTTDRYVQQASAQEVAPLEADDPLPPLDADRYPPSPLVASSAPAAEEAEGDVAIARGQTPSPYDDQPGPLEQPNPLRDAERTSSIPASAREAFEAVESTSPAATLAPAPNGNLAANPLRASGQAPLPPLEDEPNYAGNDTPPPAQFDDVRPLAAAPAASERQLEPLERYGSNAMASATPQQPTPATPPPYGNEPSSSFAQDEGDFIPAARALAVPTGSLPTEATGRPGERALEGPQRPALVLQKFAPPEIQIGKPAKFVIKVRNVGQRPAENVQIVDEVPQGTEFVSATPQAEVAGGALAWQLGNLSPGEERTVEVDLMPVAEGEIGSVARVTFASQASAKTRCTRPQLAIRLSAPSEVLVGRQQPVTIELHNPGTGDATGVMLVENVPDNVSHPAGPSLEFEVGTLRAGETRRMELVLTAEKPGHVVNVLTAQAEGNLQVQQKVEFEVIAPSLAVGIDGPTRRYLERQATYTVTVDNPGSAAARDVQLVTKLPRAMQFVSANNLGEYDANTHSVYWSLAELPEGEKGVVELVTMPVQPGEHVLEVEGRAREGLQDRTSQQVSIEGLAAIMFEVVDTADPIEVGGTTSYDIRVVNQGSKAASNVQVRVAVPQGMKVTGATGETRHSVDADGVVFAPLAKLAPKADSVFRVQLQGMRPGDQRITVEVMTDDITQPVRKEESTRVFGDE